MAACKNCGGKAGAFKEECKSCESKRLDAERLERDAQEQIRAEAEAKARAEAAQALEARKQAHVDRSLDSYRKTIQQGRTPYLYSMVSVSVPYSLLERNAGEVPDLHDIIALGRAGWEIVAVLPQTAGVGLSNVYQKGGGTTWAGGIGGIVTGAILLIRLPITSSTLDEETEMLTAALRESYEDKRSFVAPELVVPGISTSGGSSRIPPVASMALGAAGMGLMMNAASDFGIVGDGAEFDSDTGGGDFDGGGFDF